MRLAIVYDRITKIGGAEKILACLHHLWPDAPFYTSVYHRRGAPWAGVMEVRPSFLQHFPGAAAHHEWYFPLMPFAFESFDFSGFDVVISVTSAQCKGVITKPSTLHLNYYLTPTKYLYTQTDLHRQHNPLGVVGRPILDALWHRERRWDGLAALRPDQNLAISHTVARRVSEIYHLPKPPVIYPPCDVAFFKTVRPSPRQDDYFLLVSRLVPSKRVDLAIEAFNRLKLPLVIIGQGMAGPRLRKIAGPTITFLGQVDEESLAAYYQHAQAFIFPSEEDFGIVIVESLAAGTPVIAFAKGGASEIITHGKHGLLFDRQSVSSIMKSVENGQNRHFVKTKLTDRAREFDQSIFKQQFAKYVKEAWLQHQKQM